jgi:hypothetical protein
VCGENVDFIGQLQQLVMNRVIEVACQRTRQFRREQICPRRPADDQRAAAEQSRGRFAVGFEHEKGNVLGRMSRRSHHTDLKGAQINHGVFGQRLVVKAKTCLRARADRRAGLGCNLAIAGNKIGVQVGIEDMRQRKTALMGGMQVPVYVAKRIDQNPLFVFMGANQVRGVAESRIHKRFDEIGGHL